MGLAYVGNQNSSTLTVINTDGDEIVKTIPVGRNPVQVDTSFDRTEVLTANGGERSISVISTRTNQVIEIIRNVTPEPFGAVHADGKLFVPDQFTGNVTVLDAGSGTLIKRIPVVTRILSAVLHPNNQKLYVTSLVHNIWIIDVTTNQLIQSIPKEAIWGLAFTPDGKRFIANHYLSNFAAIYSTCTNRLIGKIPVGIAPIGVAISSNGERAYVTNSRSGSVSVIEIAAKRVIKTIPVGRVPYEVALSPDNRKIYVTNYGGTTVSVIDSKSLRVITTISVGAGPRGISII
ncbi:cytochrome D1 domain-containing protein [Paenibacillus herberti]|uniref:Uncharacterized protein n=1 Tax=Paenibacillus herberti TaxID=1619309 RepID=A0A229NT58_9BACL|nr:cytochrome D1 domain-containing protein [Paenibacillus herberti]OXM13070.1 hypothetical protein CGZ75_23095 [Paenibacillus herberti]